MTARKSTLGLCRAGAALLLLALLGCVQPAPSGAAALPNPPPPGAARIWIYRDYEPFQTLARPYVRLNGAIIAISEPGGAFYRDVAPGTYAVTVDTYGEDVNQFATVTVVPGQQVYVKILSLRGWVGGGGGTEGGGGGWERNTFYTRVMPSEAAQAAISRMPLYGGG